MMRALKKLRDRYVIRQVKAVRLPAFASRRVVRERILFSGRVQNVGFRLEIRELAQRLKATGFVRNRGGNCVEAEIQCEGDKIAFLIDFMKSLKRAKVKDVQVTELALKEEESGFFIVRGQ